MLAAQVEAGLEPLTDGGWPIDPADPVASWVAAASRTQTLVKAVLPGPFGTGVRTGGSVEPWRTLVARLADAGCAMIEIAEPAATRIGLDAAERIRFLDLHERLLDGWVGRPGLHLSLAISGGSVVEAGPETILRPPYASLALDLIAGPEDWRLVREAPPERGVILGVLSPLPGSDDGPEVMLWAAGYASSSGRGLDRVGLGTAGSFADLSWDVAVTKLARLGDAVRIAGLPMDQRLAAIDPRAIDSRSAALGRYEPPGRP